MRPWQPHKTRIGAMAFSPDGQLLATVAGHAKLVFLWNAATGESVRKLKGHEYAARGVAFSPDGQYIASMQVGPELKVWEVETGELFNRNGVGMGNSKTLTFTPDSKAIIAAGERELLRWPFAKTWTWEQPPLEKLPVTGATQRVGFSPAGNLVTASGGYVTIHPLPNSAEKTQLFVTPVGHGSVINGFTFTRDGTKMGVAYANRTACVWDLSQPEAKVPVLLKGHLGHVRAIGFTSDGRTAITVSLDCTSRFWDAATGAELRMFQWQIGRIVTAAFAPDGLTCAAGSVDGRVVVWDIDA
ncbi:MAG: hypothetical protein K8U57_16810 [Planctomycetes bacterium]|nr:hypothetical protein [Planctomycetota bacterium]